MIYTCAFCGNAAAEDPTVTDLGSGAMMECPQCHLKSAVVVFKPTAYKMLLLTRDLITAYVALLQLAQKACNGEEGWL